MKIVGWVLTALTALALLMSAGMKLSGAEEVMKGFVEQYGFPASTITPIGIVEILVVVIYLIPQTAVLGAILVAAYLGGATVVHVRASEPFIAPIVIAIIAWGGIYLRDARVRALIPLRSK